MKNNHGNGHPVSPDTFYTVIIEAAADSDDNFLQVFWAWAQDIGEAIAKVTATARDEEEIANPRPVEADLYDYDTLPDDVTEIANTSVFTSGARFSFPAEDSSFNIPPGVILSCLEGEYDPEELRDGFQRYADGELHCIDCVVSENRLEETFNALVAILPGIRVVWIECSDEWDDVGVRRFYTHEGLNTPTLVRDFLHTESANILRNGLLKLTVYSGEGKTNLLINDHKFIEILTFSNAILTSMTGELHSLGFEELKDLKTISRGLHHWHYKPVEAASRQDFTHQLLGNGFSLWKELPPEER